MKPLEGDKPGQDPDALSASVSHHVRALFAAAERSAAAIRREAEELAALIVERAESDARRIREEGRLEADELLAARRRELAQLSDEILATGRAALDDLESMASARAALDGLARSLRETAEQLGPAAAGEPPSPASEPRPATPLGDAPRRQAAPTSGNGGSSTAAGPGDDGGDRVAPRGLTGAPLVAVQMAQAGSTRGEVAAHLRRTFAADDVNDALNEAFRDAGR